MINELWPPVPDGRIRFQAREYRAVIFDWYLTLIEYESMLPDAGAMIRAAGYPCPDALAQMWLPAAFDGCETPRMEGGAYVEWREKNLAALMRFCGVPNGRSAGLIADIIATDAKHVVRCREYAVSLLTGLAARGVRVGVCSNWDYSLDGYLATAGLASLVNAWVTSSHVGARKPHERMFLEMCRQLDVPPSDALFCGDTWNADVVGALRSGLTPIWLSDRPSPVPAITAVSDLGELQTLLFSRSYDSPRS